MKEAVKHLQTGKIVALPTESVFGLSVDAKNEQAVMDLLALKKRPVHKGLIVSVAALSDIQDWIAPLTEEQLDTLSQYWPGPFTFILPTTDAAPKWLTGEHQGLAVRISAHPVLNELTTEFGPIVTTSANHAGDPPCMSAKAVADILGDQVAFCIDAPTGGAEKPTTIIDLVSGDTVR